MNKQIDKFVSKINKIKKTILKCQLEKLGEITVENLQNLGLDYPESMTKLKIVEDIYKENMNLKNTYDSKLKEIKEKYNIKDKSLINKEYSNKIEEMKQVYNKEYGELQEKVRALENDRLRDLRINNNYKVEVDVLTNDIYVNKKMIIDLKDKIKIINNELKDLTANCNIKINNINKKYKKKLDLYCCDTQKGGILARKVSNEKIISQCKKNNTMKSVNENELLFLEKYYYYLKEFYKLCKNYGNSANGIVKECVSFTNEQVNDKIIELNNFNNNFDKEGYNIDEEKYKNDYETDMKTTRTYFDNIINKDKKMFDLELSNIKELIKKYETMEKLKTREENNNFIDRIKKEKLEIEYQKEQLEEIYLNKSKKKLSFKGDCYKKMNDLNIEKMTILEEKKTRCKLCD